MRHGEANHKAANIIREVFDEAWIWGEIVEGTSDWTPQAILLRDKIALELKIAFSAGENQGAERAMENFS